MSLQTRITALAQAVAADVKALLTAVAGKASISHTHTAQEVGAQPTLVSGNNLKTVGGVSLLGSGDVPMGGLSVINERSGASYTLVLADANACVRLSHTAAITLTVPTNAAVALPLLTQVIVLQGGAGMVSVVAASGVTLEAPAGASTAGVGDFRLLLQRAANVWVLA
jgi:hypothetical protein